MALGARRSWITGPLVLESLTFTLVGGVLGMLATLAIVAAIGAIPMEGNEALEYLGKPVVTPWIGVFAAVVLGLIGTAAGYFPARRAAGVNPAETLRYE